MNSFGLKIGVLLFAASLPPVFAQTEQDGPEEPIIGYHDATGLTDPVAQLQKRIAEGKTSLLFDPVRGYLPAILKELRVPVSSQMLVFSKTSSQAQQTSPRTPRAVYFTDGVYIGWVPGGKVIDLAAVDPRRGPIFYTLDQKEQGPPKFQRPADCMQCHLGPKTLNVPGLLVRSVYTAPDGTPLSQVPGFINGHNSPLEERWGGWYVTGTHVGAQHLGNIFATNSLQPSRVDISAGANVLDLGDRFQRTNYLTGDSDLVALLVLEHEVRMHNLITHANYETRLALHEVENEFAERRAPTLRDPNTAHSSAVRNSGWPQQRIAHAGEMLLEYMLFRNEAPLKGPVKGTSAFAQDFQRHGPRDAKARSLRDLDLKTRLLRYPCSFLIYSASFDELPKEMKDYLWARLKEILTGADRSPVFAGMPAPDRQAILEILRDTKPEFAAWLSNHQSAIPKSELSSSP